MKHLLIAIAVLLGGLSSGVSSFISKSVTLFPESEVNDITGKTDRVEGDILLHKE